ncbi:MAG: pilus assembly PilX N-terminal domain-containing protein [Thermoanaerobaculia bacterium]
MRANLRPSTLPRVRRASAERGSALILALLVIVVLTAVGIGLSYMSSVEDRMSGNAQREKAGFYAAEVGLRNGEALLNGGSMASTGTLTALLGATPAAPPTGGSQSSIQPPGGGYPAVLLTLNGVSYRDQVVTMPTGVRDRATYSLYVRNDREDVTGAQKTDQNLIVNLISVGVVQSIDANGKVTGIVRITKMLEEQISSVNTGSEGGPQYLGTGGGTSSSSK